VSRARSERHTAAPAITDMNSRRLIAALKAQGKGIVAAQSSTLEEALDSFKFKQRSRWAHGRCLIWVRSRLPAVDKAGTKGRNAPKADRKWPRAENDACRRSVQTEETSMHNEPLQKPQDARQTPWNKGKLIGSKPPLRTKDVWSIRTKLQVEKRTRDLAMFNLAIDSKRDIATPVAWIT
jgi:hypothetical protein